MTATNDTTLIPENDSIIDTTMRILKQPTWRNVLISANLRFFGIHTLFSFLPVFFISNFPEYKTEYASLNTLALTIFGIAASGVEIGISSTYEKKTYWTNALVNIG